MPKDGTISQSPTREWVNAATDILKICLKSMRNFPGNVLQNESIQEGNSQGVLLQIEHPGTYLYVPIQVQTY
jgi:hypothetical protein